MNFHCDHCAKLMSSEDRKYCWPRQDMKVFAHQVETLICHSCMRISEAAERHKMVCKTMKALKAE